ncbi:hypothetical protein [Acinetobacter sp. GXMZU3951]
MNVLEKAQLAKEIQGLIHGLDQRSLSFYEIAKSKSRLKEIFLYCDEPIFRKQILNFKSLMQPERTAQEFAQQSLYVQSFRGVFRSEQALEHALEQSPEMGWGILYQADLGFQFWYIPAPHRTALLSDWEGLEHNYAWMQEQQELYHGLKTDAELHLEALEAPKGFKASKKLRATATRTQPQPSFSSARVADSTMSTSAIHFEPLSLQQHATAHHTAEPKPSFNDTFSDVESNLQPTSEPSKKVAVTPANIRALFTPTETAQILPQMLELGSWKCGLKALEFPQAQEYALCSLSLENVPELFTSLDMIVPASRLEQLANQPVYLAEQINAQGQFMKYLAILGAEDQLQAIRFANIVSQHYAYQVTALKLLETDHALKCCKNTTQLFELYSEQAQLVWNTEQALPFIPANCLQKHKLIAFEETSASYTTPLILLKERQKIRVIHGQQRLQLSRQETAYPYILLDRNQGISWQLIQRVVQTLPQPISATKLHEALQIYIDS